MNTPLVLFYLVLLLSVLLTSATSAESAEEGLDADRVAEVAAMLPERPAGLGRPITDRAAWDALAAKDAYQQVIARAEKLLS